MKNRSRIMLGREFQRRKSKRSERNDIFSELDKYDFISKKDIDIMRSTIKDSQDMGKPTSELRGYDYDYNREKDWIGTSHQDAMWIGHSSISRAEAALEQAEKRISDADVAISNAELKAKTKQIFWRKVRNLIKVLASAFCYFGLPILIFILLGSYEVIPSTFAFFCCMSWMMVQIAVTFVAYQIWETAEKEATLKLKQEAQRGDITIIEEEKK